MKRREFLISSLAIPLVFKQIASAKENQTTNYHPATEKTFEFFEVTGSYRDIGFQTGRQFKKHITKLIERRSGWHQNLMNILTSRPGQEKSREYIRLTEKHFPHILQEIQGIADGSGIHFNAIWAMCIKSELGALDNEPKGCSTLFYRDQQRLWLFHNEDGHEAYRDIMFVLKAAPPSGVEYISMVYPGIITGNGPSMNNCGIIQTTNYIGSTESEIGLPRYIIGRAVLEAKALQEALEIATLEPRAYPYHHNIGHLGEKKYVSLETTPLSWQAEEPQANYFHTNHLIFNKTRDFEFEDEQYKNTSSLSRYQVIEKELPQIPFNNPVPEDCIKILASHTQAPYSPCRHPQGEVTGSTLGTAFFDFKDKKMRIFRGNPCESAPQGRFADFTFETLE